MRENSLKELILYENGLSTKSGRELGELRRKFLSFAYKIAPKWECSGGLLCHVFTPNLNCFYDERLEDKEQRMYSYSEEIETYEDFAGFCPILFDFLCFIGKNLKQGKDYSLESHNCKDWLREYFDSMHNPKEYEKCIICGDEF